MKNPSLKKYARCYYIDLLAALRFSDRDSRGRFVKGNRYRFQARTLMVAGIPVPVVSQDALVGDFFWYAGKRVRIVSATTGELI